MTDQRGNQLSQILRPREKVKGRNHRRSRLDMIIQAITKMNPEELLEIEGLIRRYKVDLLKRLQKDLGVVND